MKDYLIDPATTRPDLTPYLIHLTKRKKDETPAREVLWNILKTGVIQGSSNCIAGPNPAACFSEIPFFSLQYHLQGSEARYEPFGVVLAKTLAFEKGCRPVLYLSETDERTLNIPINELWRVVRFDKRGETWVSWLHEREWRCKGSFSLPSQIRAVLVRGLEDSTWFMNELIKGHKELKTVPASIIPLNVVSQGLKLKDK